ncbi:lipoate--protein ligase family protein [Sulfurimonas autotrophica]|uniref:Biotin/lipoate A/B protein ligase n=1 Tax=Sulfurimonas autotrophica (strain ATCC BAA-671 / DSM 16294 / JCM 11897 / OK10) TaxID=563040 RepID=E0UPL2_SULAO|nr:lipoate--protein ligase family protein [Sulfurimonas autotrophica]ADN08604.1 biotin/lipoate A/B protein ligase [Sulfurimonas autotrophica DSM 16294]
MQIWNVIDTGIGSPDWNMAVDEALLYTLSEGDRPIFRIYGWNKSLSFGRFSKPHKSLDMNELSVQRVSYVRRPSGGGILVHGGDISYSIIMPRKMLKSYGIKESYNYLCKFLIKFYEKLKLKAEFASDLDLDIQSSDICLAGHEAYDIIIDEKKMGGNAQRYIKNTLLQHGTIPVHFDKEYFEPLFLEDSGLKDAASLRELDVTMEYKDLTNLLIESFCETFNVKFSISQLNPFQQEYAENLLRDKYTQEDWNIYGK